MKIDLNEFNDVDFENIGGWPTKVKVVFALFVAFSVILSGYFAFISDSMEQLSNAESREQQLKMDFKSKYLMAANLNLYREQLAEMEEQFSDLLKMLPSENEMPGLLDDLTYVATDSGLRMESLNWESEIDREFYQELPINMSVNGDYHQLGSMVAGVAKLPRIVSFHDFVVTKQADGSLAMNIQARTYRFKEGNELINNSNKGGN